MHMNIAESLLSFLLSVQLIVSVATVETFWGYPSGIVSSPAVPYNLEPIKEGAGIPTCGPRTSGTYKPSQTQYQCFPLLHDDVRKHYDKCFQKDSCWWITRGVGECAKPPLARLASDYEGGAAGQSQLKEFFYDHEKTAVMAQLRTDGLGYAAPSPATHKGPIVMPSVDLAEYTTKTYAVCCQMSSAVKIGKCKKLAMNTTELQDFVKNKITTSMFVRDVPRGGMKAPYDLEFWTAQYELEKSYKPATDVERCGANAYSPYTTGCATKLKNDGQVIRTVEVCEIESVDKDSGCPFTVATAPDDLHDHFKAECKTGACPKESRCDPGATSPETMCTKCDDNKCGSIPGDPTPAVVDCKDGMMCAVVQKPDTQTTCTDKPDAKDKCQVCSKDGKACHPFDAQFVKPRKDVPCKGGNCPVGSTCDEKATSVEEMCLKDGKPVPPNKYPEGTKCLGGLCPPGVMCDKEATDPKSVCRNGDKISPPLFPPGVKCLGGLCPLGSTCNIRATAADNMCLGKDGSPVKPVKAPAGVECNGGLCPVGSTCSKDACSKGAVPCLKMCTGPDGEYVAPVFPGGVKCPNGGLCPAGTSCNPKATSIENMCLSSSGKPVPGLRGPPGVPCNGGVCPLNSICVKGAAPEKMCKLEAGGFGEPLLSGLSPAAVGAPTPAPAAPAAVCPGSTDYQKDEPGPSPWVFKGYHQQVKASTIDACKKLCDDDPVCGQAAFVKSKGEVRCYIHYVRKGVDICETKHEVDVLHSCDDDGTTCTFFNKICKDCQNIEHKLLGKLAFCHGAGAQELLEMGKQYCGGAPQAALLNLFKSLGVTAG